MRGFRFPAASRWLGERPPPRPRHCAHPPGIPWRITSCAELETGASSTRDGARRREVLHIQPKLMIRHPPSHTTVPGGSSRCGGARRPLAEGQGAVVIWCGSWIMISAHGVILDVAVNLHFHTLQGFQVAKLVFVAGENHAGERATAIILAKPGEGVAAARSKNPQHLPATQPFLPINEPALLIPTQGASSSPPRSALSGPGRPNRGQ